MDTVYIETTVVGNLAGRMHPDPLIASRQTVTRHGWSTATTRFRLLASQLVLDECSAGDPTAAAERLTAIAGIELLITSDVVEQLAVDLVAGGAVPASQPRDAFHIAIAAANGIQYLATWNFKHIGNALLQNRIADICRDAGFEPPIICTPEQLSEDDHDDPITN
jgi:predicted nucleic acid-binding protein